MGLMGKRASLSTEKLSQFTFQDPIYLKKGIKFDRLSLGILAKRQKSYMVFLASPNKEKILLNGKEESSDSCAQISYRCTGNE